MTVWNEICIAIERDRNLIRVSDKTFDALQDAFDAIEVRDGCLFSKFQYSNESISCMLLNGYWYVVTCNMAGDGGFVNTLIGVNDSVTVV